MFFQPEENRIGSSDHLKPFTEREGREIDVVHHSNRDTISAFCFFNFPAVGFSSKIHSSHERVKTWTKLQGVNGSLRHRFVSSEQH